MMMMICIPPRVIGVLLVVVVVTVFLYKTDCLAGRARANFTAGEI